MQSQNGFSDSHIMPWEVVKQPQKDRIGFPVFALGVLITSFFYTLPLGRFTLGYLATDYRIHDFIFAAFFLFVGLKYWPQLRHLQRDRSRFHYWAAFLLVLVWLSLIITFITGGLVQLLPAMIRSIRFTAYFLTAGYVVVLVDTPRRYRFLLGVIYANIAVQALIAFLQSFGYLPNFWPDYWVVLYGRLPVGTLSPHHKQIGVVMLLGVALTLSLLRISRSLPKKFILLGLMSVMLTVSILTRSRTSWLGFGAFALGYIFMHRSRSIGTSVLAVLGVFFFFWLTRDMVLDPVQDQINLVFLDRIERFGIEGVVGERLGIYEYLPRAIQKYPWILLTGTGFENIVKLTRVSGAHNNYFQALFELGIFGFIVYMLFLVSVLRSLNHTAIKVASPMENSIARDSWAAFVAVMATLLVGETLWAQPSMRTLTGQIMTLMALATCPLNWILDEETEGEEELIESPLFYSRR